MQWDFSLSCILGFCGTTNVDAYVITAPCSDTSAKVCQIEVETTTSRGSQDGYDEKNTGADNANQEIQQQYTYSTVNQGNGVKGYLRQRKSQYYVMHNQRRKNRNIQVHKYVA